MGEHSAPGSGFLARVRSAFARVGVYVTWVIGHRRKIASAIIIGLPFVSRFWPGFPTADIEAFLRMYFGA